VGLLALVTFSYEQTIHAYPGGGGAYIVARDNLGELAAQVAGAALLMDYIQPAASDVVGRGSWCRRSRQCFAGASRSCSWAS
jgi:amino acid transporter